MIIKTDEVWDSNLCLSDGVPTNINNSLVYTGFMQGSGPWGIVTNSTNNRGSSIQVNIKKFRKLR
jgi:hypothetical protein